MGAYRPGRHRPLDLGPGRGRQGRGRHRRWGDGGGSGPPPADTSGTGAPHPSADTRQGASGSRPSADTSGTGAPHPADGGNRRRPLCSDHQGNSARADRCPSGVEQRHPTAAPRPAGDGAPPYPNGELGLPSGEKTRRQTALQGPRRWGTWPHLARNDLNQAPSQSRHRKISRQRADNLEPI